MVDFETEDGHYVQCENCEAERSTHVGLVLFGVGVILGLVLVALVLGLTIP